MHRFSNHLSKRGLLICAVAGALTVSAAGAATFHRLTVSETTGSGGATTVLQTSSTSSALQAEVATSARTGVNIPFGLFGAYDATGSTVGIGVIGLSKTGYGVAAESLAAMPSIFGQSGGENVGIFANAPASAGGSPFEASALNSSDAGVFMATTGKGIHSLVQGPDGGQSLYGENSSSKASTVAANNYQPSPPPELDYGGGVYATAQGPGLYAESFADPGVTSVFDCNQYVDSSGSDGGLGGSTCAGLYVIQNSTSGWPLLVYNSTTNAYPFYVDADGNVNASGTFQAMTDVTRTKGTDLMAYGAKQTEETVEDFGTASLQNGVANVALRPDFRATINQAAPYMVFMTPHGDNRGLFVASSGPQGFTIRESQGGRSSLAFDYRIVARPPGAASPRLPRSSSIAPHQPRTDRASPARYATVRDRMLHRQGMKARPSGLVPGPSFQSFLRR